MTRAQQFPGSAGCQPAVGGSLPPRLICVAPKLHAKAFGKLPNAAGWQPALPERENDDHALEP